MGECDDETDKQVSARVEKTLDIVLQSLLLQVAKRTLRTEDPRPLVDRPPHPNVSDLNFKT